MDQNYLHYGTLHYGSKWPPMTQCCVGQNDHPWHMQCGSEWPPMTHAIWIRMTTHDILYGSKRPPMIYAMWIRMTTHDTCCLDQHNHPWHMLCGSEWPPITQTMWLRMTTHDTCYVDQNDHPWHNVMQVRILLHCVGRTHIHDPVLVWSPSPSTQNHNEQVRITPKTHWLCWSPSPSTQHHDVQVRITPRPIGCVGHHPHPHTIMSR